ncbi:MAG: hypothetical protein ACTSVY_12145 [Candidatus Helarchaeota archaeon]
MATVFERLEILVKELASKIEDISTEIKSINDRISDVKSEVNSMFLNFSDIISERFEEIGQKLSSVGGTATATGESSKAVEDLRVLIESFIEKVPSTDRVQDISEITSLKTDVTDLKDSVEMLKDAMNYVTDTIGDVSKKIELIPTVIEKSLPKVDSEEKPKPLKKEKAVTPKIKTESKSQGFEKVIYKGAIRDSQRPKKATVEPAIRPDIARIYSGVLKTPGTPSTVKKTQKTSTQEVKTIKVESTPRTPPGKVPDEVFHLLENIKQKINIPIDQLAIFMENTRDEIVKIYKFHPALYELGTFARKLRKYPPNTTLEPDIMNLLVDKINEWKKRLVF